jgi:hypothetical protein
VTLRVWLRSLCVSLAVLAGTVSSWSGCAPRVSRPAAPPTTASEEPEAVYQELVEWAGRIRSLQGAGTVRLRSQESNTRLDALVVCEHPGRLRVEALDFLDHVVFVCILQGGEFLAYFVSENRVVRKPAVPSVIEEYVGVPLEGDELAALVLGSPFFVPLVSPNLETRREESGLVLTATSPERGVRYEVRLDAQRRPVQSVLRWDPRSGAGGGALQVDFSEYRRAGTLDFPFRVRVSDVERGDHFSVHYQQVTLNPVLDEQVFHFVPPADAQGTE